MKILFDIRLTQEQSTRGIGLYFTSLIEHLSKFPIEITILADNNFPIPFPDEFIKSVEIIYFSELNSYKYYEHNFDFLFFDDLVFTRHFNNDTFFEYLFPEVIMKYTNQIISLLHDTIYIFCVKPENKTAYSKLAIQLESLNIVNHFFSNSESTRNDFIKYLNIKPSDITTIYGGVGFKTPINFSPYDSSKRKNHIVSVLGEHFRKNSEGLIKGFATAIESKYISKDSILYICFNISDGYKSNLSELVKKNNLSDKQVIITGFIPEKELIELISTAKGTIFPSFYEGLGMPILESYAIGTPCFASNISSMKELVLPECTLDPYDTFSIAFAIKQLFTNPQLCQKSAQFGRELIQNNVNWDCAAKKVYTKLLLLKKSFSKPDCNTAVFGVLPPEKSGIANYNAKIFSLNKNFHVYSKFEKYKYFNDAVTNITKLNNIFSIDIFSIANSLFNYNKKIFVLGNSYHNIPYLKAAIEEKDKAKCFLYCHEINLQNLLYLFIGFHDFKHVIKTVYPDIFQDNLDINNLSFEEIKKIVSYGFRAILSITNISNVIVNNDKAKQLLLEEIKDTIFENTVSITTVFLPIANLDLKADIKPINIDFDGFKIGSFGICNIKDKATDIIIKSVALLNEKYDIKAKCVLAGYEVDIFIQSEVPSKYHKYLLSFSDCSDDQLLSVMNQVDIAVQLRKHPWGESSGVVSQLLGLNKRIIASEKFLDSRFEDYCTIVPSFISENELVKIFYDIYMNNITINTSDLIKNFGFDSLADTILNI
jgi:glycosyltransferase involved in cell wall biosynthesis